MVVAPAVNAVVGRKTCKKGGFLVASSFCTASFHNTEACLGDAKLQSSTPATPSTLATSPTFPCRPQSAPAIAALACRSGPDHFHFHVAP